MRYCFAKSEFYDHSCKRAKIKHKGDVQKANWEGMGNVYWLSLDDITKMMPDCNWTKHAGTFCNDNRINVHRFADGVDHDGVDWCGFPVHDMFRRINVPLSQVIRLALIRSS